MNLIVAIATLGRPDMVVRTIAHLAGQTRLPDEVVVSATCPEDIGELGQLPFPVTQLIGPKGSCAQRNSALDHGLARSDIITFFDDDFLPADTYLEDVEAAFRANDDWIVIGGNVILDGINTSGVTFEQGLRALEQWDRDLTIRQVTEHGGAYGCNMSMRSRDIGDLRFDERLVLYGWQEDVDFTARVGNHGKIVKLSWLPGVHLGVKSGRVSGLRFGYSQIVNPIYLATKGTIGPLFAANLLLRNLCSNFLWCFRPEPWIDRRGRLKGNMLALLDLVKGQAKPERVLNL